MTILSSLDLAEIVLEDDDTPAGGVAFKGETLEDFIEEDDNLDGKDLEVINSALKECGIKPVTLDQVKLYRKPFLEDKFITTEVKKRDNVDEYANEYPWRAYFFYKGVIFYMDDFMEKPNQKQLERTAQFAQYELSESEIARLKELANERADEKKN